MNRPFSALLITAFVVTGCGFSDSNLNPFNWFGDSNSVATEAEAAANPLVPDTRRSRRDAPKPYLGTPIQTVTSMRIDKTPGGAILHATGVARMQGGYLANLTPATEDAKPVDGVLTFRFEIILPAGQRAVGATTSREITVARRLTDQDLIGVRSIRVEGVTNAQVSRR